MKEFAMAPRDSKKDQNYQVMSGPTSERVFASVAEKGYINQQNNYKAIKNKNGG